MSACLEEGPRFGPLEVHDLADVVTIENLVYPFPWTSGNFRDSLAGNHRCLGCWYRGRLVGYALLMIALDEAHLLNITIHPDCQGRGLGRALLRHVMEVAGAAGCLSLLLEVRPSNQVARSLYEKLGFARIGVRRGYYPDVGGREDALVLRRGLP